MTGFFNKLQLAAPALFAGVMLSMPSTSAVAQSYQVQAIGQADSQTYIDYADGLTSNGEVLGHSEYSLPNGGTHANIWLYTSASGTQTVHGLTDANHTPPAGSTNYNNYISAVINDSGQITGNTPRFKNGNYTGYDSWFFSPITGQTQLIGIVDADHTTVDGLTGNFPERINSAGQVQGTVARNDPQGNTNDVWLYSPQTNTTQLIGVFDAAHTRTDGSRSSYATALSDSGLVVGSVTRYAGNLSDGQDAWVYQSSAHTAQVINLSSSFDGTWDRVATQVNNKGQIAGSAGGQAWFADSPNSVGHLIGPTDSIHTSEDGTTDTAPLRMDPAGHVMGHAGRFVGLQERGQDIWYYTPATDQTQIIGLTDAAHTIGNGREYNEGIFLNNAGQVAGDAETSDMQSTDGWLFDPATDTTYLIALPTGYSLGNIQGLNNNGEVIGYMYGFGHDTGFTWTESGGVQMLDSMLVGSLAANGWSNLDVTMQINDNGQIAGYGTTANGQLSGFLLTPTPVPEPSAMALVGLFLSAGMPRKNRKRD